MSYDAGNIWKNFFLKIPGRSYTNSNQSFRVFSNPEANRTSLWQKVITPADLHIGTSIGQRCRRSSAH